MKTIKITSILIAIFMLLGLFSACETESKTATLYTNMESGSDSPNIKEHSFSYTGEITAEKLAKGLTDLTGLDFNIKSKKTDDGVSIDWDKKSTLIADLGDKEQKEEFFFFDNESMRWFMLDSLWLTLTKNLGTENVYYTFDGGNDLVFEELYPVKMFPADLPYMGAAFYFAHADSIGEDAKG